MAELLVPYAHVLVLPGRQAGLDTVEIAGDADEDVHEPCLPEEEGEERKKRR